MKIFKNISWLCCLFATVCFVTSCSSDDEQDGLPNGYGYVQLMLSKKQTRAANTTLDYLSKAKKIEISLLSKDGIDIKQSLNLSAINTNAAEFGLQSELLQLAGGEYTIKGYVLYGAPVMIDGEASAPIIQEGSPDETMKFEVVSGHTSPVAMGIDVTNRGEISFMLGKDMSSFDKYKAKTKTRATKTEILDNKIFDYEQVVEMDLILRKAGTTETYKTYVFKTYRRTLDKFFHTDTLSLPAGKYELKQYSLYTDKRQECIFAADLSQTIEVLDNVSSRDTVSVVYPENSLVIGDYLALKTIWLAMDGPSWSYVGQSYPNGSNWRFAGRPVDEWGAQPGVEIGNGRVKTLMLGAFNPKGAIPEELGVLTELEMLWLGTHDDTGEGLEPEMKMIDSYTLHRKGVDLRANRWAIGKEKLALKHSRKYTSELDKTMQEKYHKQTFKYATYGTAMQGSISNRITKIPESIGKLTKLTQLFVANNYVSDLPLSLKNCTEITDAEFYNCKFTKFPEVLKEIPLVALNFSYNSSIPPAKFHEGLNDFLSSPIIQRSLQLLYLNDNNLEAFPEAMYKTLNIGLLDMAYNKIKTVPTPPIPDENTFSPVQFFIDYNELEAIPDNFCHTADVEKFSVEGNKLTVFPNIFRDELSEGYELLNVNFSNNKIYKFCDGFEQIKIEELNLSFNDFGNPKGSWVKDSQGKKKRMLPSELSETSSEIKYLKISNCGLDTLPTVSFENFKYLVALEAMGNKFQYMNGDFNSETFPYVTGIDLSFNSLKRFPSLLLNINSLNQLLLGGQSDKETGERCMTEWPENFEKHYAMRVLSVTGNDIRKVRVFPAGLNYLDITDNPNIEIDVPGTICSRISAGTFQFVYDSNQYITGCPILNLDK